MIDEDDEADPDECPPLTEDEHEEPHSSESEYEDDEDDGVRECGKPGRDSKAVQALRRSIRGSRGQGR